MKWLAVLMLVPLLAAGVPPLTDTQRTLLETANDGSFNTDEAALYPLLQNATTWQPGSEAGAAIPDYAAIMADPAAHRGELFLIEGVFNGKPRSQASLLKRVARPGAWDDTLQEWYVITDRQTEQVAVVYLVNPGTSPTDPPPAGTKVRIPARFFKVYKANTLESANSKTPTATPFLVFVGHSPSNIEAGSATSEWTYLVPALLLVMLALAGYYTLKRKKVSVAAQPLATRVRRQQREEHEEEEVEEGPPLPKEPTEALDELSRRHTDTTGASENT
jgi:hypothetical protein